MKTLSIVLIAALLWSSMPAPCLRAAEDLRGAATHHPDGRVYKVSPEEFSQIEPRLRELESQGAMVVVQMAQADSGAGLRAPISAVPNDIAGGTTNGVTSNTVFVATNAAPASLSGKGAASHLSSRPSAAADPDEGRTCNGFLELTHDLGGSNWSGSDGAIVIFVVVGTVAVLAMVVYAGAFLYDVATGEGEHSYWWDMEAQTSFLCSHANSGYMAGARISSGFENAEARVGLVIEGGGLNVSILPEDAIDKLDLEGGYGMAGAGVRWPISGVRVNPSFFGLELLAGTASDDRVHMMSTARANLSFGLGSRLRLGVSLGALYLGLETTEGPIKDIDNFTTLVGIQAGYRF